MRKALILLVVFALVGAAAFADGTAKWSITTNYGFAFTSPPSPAQNDLTPFDWAQEGTGRTRLGFTYTSADGNAGFNSRLQMTNLVTQTAIFNQLNGWAKLFGGMLTVRAGLLDDYTISTQDWNDYGNTDGKFGVYFNIAPMAGLDIGIFQAVPAVAGAVNANFPDGDIIGAKYAIKDIGDLNAGVSFGSGLTTGVTNIFAGFNFKGMTGLTAVVEGQITMLPASAGTGFAFDENLAYVMGPLTVGARVGELYSTVTSTFDWGIEPSVAYKVNDNLTVNAIANVYSTLQNDALLWASGALYAAIINGGVAAGEIGFGAGASVSWAASGFTVTIGDYYSMAASPNGGNAFYISGDVSL